MKKTTTDKAAAIESTISTLKIGGSLISNVNSVKENFINDYTIHYLIDRIKSPEVEMKLEMLTNKSYELAARAWNRLQELHKENND